MEVPVDQNSEFVIPATVYFFHASQCKWIDLDHAVYSYPRCIRDAPHISAVCFLLVLHCCSGKAVCWTGTAGLEQKAGHLFYIYFSSWQSAYQEYYTDHLSCPYGNPKRR